MTTRDLTRARRFRPDMPVREENGAGAGFWRPAVRDLTMPHAILQLGGKAQRRMNRVLAQEAVSCKRKRVYVTRDEALAAKTHGDRIGLAEYQCLFCGGWHLTKSENWTMLVGP